MDELEMVRGFRAEAASPTPDVRRAARTALFARIDRESRPGRRGRRLAKCAPLAATVAILVALMLVLPVLDGGRGSGTAAARELRTLASVAAQQPDEPTLTTGTFAYTRSEAMWINTSASVDGGVPVTTLSVPFTREIWIGADGSGRIREATGDSSAFGTAPSPDHNWDASFGAGELMLPLTTWDFTPELLERLSADPGALAAEIRKRAEMNEQPVEHESFVIVGDLLREAVAPAGVRAALFEVAASIPDVELLGTVEDPVGRSGTAVAYTHDGIRSELIFDPATSKLLAERQMLVAPVDFIPFPVGTVIGYAAYLDAGIVPSASAMP